jgi:hypothetical protein
MEKEQEKACAAYYYYCPFFVCGYPPLEDRDRLRRVTHNNTHTSHDVDGIDE